MQLLLDIVHLRVMIRYMSDRTNPNAAVEACGSVPGSRRSKTEYSEVNVKKILSMVMAGVLVAVLFVGAILSAAAGATRSKGGLNRQGLMPEVVVRAEKPRLVMPCVEVQALRAMAMTSSSFNVN